MLQAFADLSQGGQNSPPMLVLGGFIAPAERWAAFSTAWQKVLDLEPKLDYFSYREAERRIDQFSKSRWTEAARDGRVALFRQVIEDYDLTYFAIAFAVDAYQRVMAPWRERKVQNPYFFAQGQIMAAVAGNLHELGFDHQQVDFIFDRQYMEESTISAAWNFVEQIYKRHPTHPYADIFINPPTFRDDVDVLPLQAADLIVRQIQINFANGILGKPLIPWGFTKKLPGLLLTYTEEQLRAAEIKRAEVYERARGKRPYDP